MSNAVPVPTDINFHQHSRNMEITFGNGECYKVTCEFLRVFSPSAEVRGHTEAEAVLQVGKADVNIEKIEPVGNYAICLHFDDGHNSGIYSWEWLYYLCKNHDTLWQDYLDKLEKAGQKRSPSTD